jgi:uracil-DNA glycosylase
MNIQEIKNKFYEKLKPSGWDVPLKGFINSFEFEKIVTSLYNLSNEGKRFTPPLKQVFRAFEECPYDKLQVIIIGQDPYPTLGVADGIAFSCSNTNKLQPSLKFILQEIDRTVYDNKVISKDLDLKRWSNQGVLMLNTALTVEVGKIGSHYDIWKPFTAYLLDTLNTSKEQLIYVYMGKKAEEWSEITNNSNLKFSVKHPASAAYSGSKWDSNYVFIRISEKIKKINDNEIIW